MHSFTSVCSTLPRLGLGQSIAVRSSCSRRRLHVSTKRLASHVSSQSTTTTASLQSEAIRRRQAAYRQRNRSLLMYSASAFIVGIGLTYAAVPLYRAFCSATGFGGAPMVGIGKFEASKLFILDVHLLRIGVLMKMVSV